MLTRRNLLTALVGAAVAGAAGAAAAQGAPEADKDLPASKKLPWRNWSGSQRCLPEARVAPASVDELRQLLAETRGPVRPVGAGHSFTPLVPTDGTMVSLARLSGLIEHDPASLQATVWAGSRLGALGRPLEQAGQAMINMPDIDEQALAGCLATATHGTGAGIGCISTFVTALEIVNAGGDVVSCSADREPELFQAARVSLGALGFITKVTLQNETPYRLHRQILWREIDEMLEIADSLADQHRNFEFFYIPFSGMGFMDLHDYTAAAVGASEQLDPNEGVEELRLIRDYLDWSPRLRQLILGSYMKTLDNEYRVESSWKNYASERNVRFNEMEYHLPREHGLDALRKVRRALEKHHHEVFFPLEVRWVQGDDIWLSPFYQRDTISIAVHRYFDEDFTAYFNTIEPIFREYQGRPHWGKLNTLDRAALRALYPRWNDFAMVRREMDPQGRFLNAYLQGLFT